MKTHRILTQGYDLILGNPLKSVKYVPNNYDKAIARAKEEEEERANVAVMNSEEVAKWNEVKELTESSFGDWTGEMAYKINKKNGLYA